jgi:hypothetical protein
MKHPKGSADTARSWVIVQLFAPSVGVNGAKAGEEPSVTKPGEVKENEKLWTGPLAAS